MTSGGNTAGQYGDMVLKNSVAYSATMPTGTNQLYEVTGSFATTTINAWTIGSLTFSAL